MADIKDTKQLDNKNALEIATPTALEIAAKAAQTHFNAKAAFKAAQTNLQKTVQDIMGLTTNQVIALIDSNLESKEKELTEKIESLCMFLCRSS